MNETDLKNVYYFDDIIEVNEQGLFYENGDLIPKENFKHPKNGTFRAYTKNGYLYLEINYINNKKNGETKCYFEDTDTLHWINYYVEDKLDGACKTYYSNGNVDEINNYVEGKKEGISKSYYESGKLYAEECYSNNKKNGLSKLYYISGQLLHEAEFINDKQNGRSIKYYINGKPEEDTFWENNICVSRKSYFKTGEIESVKEKGAKFEYWYYKTGELDCKIALKNNVRHGEFIDYYKNGKIKRTGFYKNKKFDGEVVGYFNSGKVKFIINFKAGVKQGDRIYYWANGNVQEIAEFNNGLAHGKLTKYYKNGNKEYEYDYKNDLIDGYAIHWDSDGNMISKTLYEKGECVDNILNEIISVTENNDQEKECQKGQRAKRKSNKTTTKSNFRLDFVNCSRDIENLTEKIIKSGRLDFSICIYGEPGVGKSAYAEYLAEKLGLSVVKKAAADILDQYIGNSEQKIKEAFDEASKKKAVLIIDEVDSFLRSRGMSQKSWEVTIVNQMLTSMQEFKYPFFCTTNFVDILDDASLRRFTFKLKFGFLKPEQVKNAFEFVFQRPINNKISVMKGLTVSDFVNVKKECDILEINDIDEISNMLQEIVSLKKSDELKNSIGF